MGFYWFSGGCSFRLGFGELGEEVSTLNPSVQVAAPGRGACGDRAPRLPGPGVHTGASRALRRSWGSEQPNFNCETSANPSVNSSVAVASEPGCAGRGACAPRPGLPLKRRRANPGRLGQPPAPALDTPLVRGTDQGSRLCPGHPGAGGSGAQGGVSVMEDRVASVPARLGDCTGVFRR